jgi:hypothetical protein
MIYPLVRYTLMACYFSLSHLLATYYVHTESAFPPSTSVYDLPNNAAPNALKNNRFLDFRM